MRKLVVQLTAFALVTGAVYVGVFQREWAYGMYRKLTRQAKGYRPAKTPTEALDRFREAVKERDYETAATYCTGDYAEQMRKGAKAAEALGRAIDNLLSNMDDQGVKSDKTRLVLGYLEPFPTAFQVPDIKGRGEDRAVALMVEDSAPGSIDWRGENWNIDPFMIRPLAQGLSYQIELVREGQGDGTVWKIHFPVTPALRTAVDRLNDRYKDYVRALDKVKFEVKNDPVTRSDVERRLKAELEEVR